MGMSCLFAPGHVTAMSGGIATSTPVAGAGFARPVDLIVPCGDE
ncbi:hypothetical protein ACOI1H_00545 [Loktanella sp. DJP18]